MELSIILKIVAIFVAVIGVIIAYMSYMKKAQINKTNQTIIGKGDIIGGDKVYGDKITGDKIVNSFNQDKKDS